MKRSEEENQEQLLLDRISLKKSSQGNGGVVMLNIQKPIIRGYLIT